MENILEALEKGDTELFITNLNSDPEANNYIKEFLIGAASCGHLDIVRFLHERGADPTHLNCKAHYVATMNHHIHVAYYLAQQGAHFRQRYNSEFILISLHISKTAGTTLGNIFSRLYPFNQQLALSPLRSEPIGIGHVDDIIQCINNSTLSPEGIALTGGHVPFGFHEMLPKSAKYICTVREPIDRLLSGFFYSTNAHEGSYLDIFEVFLKLAKENIYDNYMTRVLSGVGEISWDLSAQPNKRPLTHNDYLSAIKNLDEHFELIGLTEHFDVYLMLLKRRFGWNIVEMVEKKANITAERKKVDEIPVKIIKKLKKLNKYDSMLYKYAYERFCKEVLKGGTSLIADVIAFRKISELCEQDNHGLISVQIAEIMAASQTEAQRYSDPLSFFNIKTENESPIWRYWNKFKNLFLKQRIGIIL